MLQEAVLQRLDRGLRGIASGLIRILSQTSALGADGQQVLIWEVWSAQSSRQRPKTYNVGYKPATGQWRCTCPDFQKRGQACKHILVTQLYHQQRVEA